MEANVLECAICSHFYPTSFVYSHDFPYTYTVTLNSIHPGGALGYNDKVITYREYANSYYRDFFDYTRTKRSENIPGADAGLIMSRPVDCLLDGVSKVGVLN